MILVLQLFSFWIASSAPLIRRKCASKYGIEFQVKPSFCWAGKSLKRSNRQYYEIFLKLFVFFKPPPPIIWRRFAIDLFCSCCGDLSKLFWERFRSLEPCFATRSKRNFDLKKKIFRSEINTLKQSLLILYENNVIWVWIWEQDQHKSM